jgi:ribosomal-protein-alanine N-acetyltransferase
MLQKELDTERLHLRQLTDADAPGIMAIRSNPQVNKYVGRSNTCTLNDAIAFIGKIKNLVADGGGFYWAITLKENNELIGTICYWNLEPAEDKAEIGYELLPDYQGQGYMTEAVDAVFAFGFESLNFKLITAFPVADNLSSAKLLERRGFVLAGDFIDNDSGKKHLDYRLSKP